MTILIDNYDSFTYNLVQYFGDLGVEPNVVRNDAASAQSIIDQNPPAIIISPGPATPDEAGICLDLVELASKYDIPVLGICLGHQTIGQVFGGTIIRAPEPAHGKIWDIDHDSKGLFENIDIPAKFTRYHSLIIDQATCPDVLDITATSTTDNLIMAVQHQSLPIYGVQFHPESIASEHGKTLLANFLSLAKAHNKTAGTND